MSAIQIQVGTRARAWVTHQHFPIAMVILASTIINFILVFKFSSFNTYLDSDMGGYWERAWQIFNGEPKEPNTWVSNAPFYSRVIAVFFTWLNFFNVQEYFLHALLSINIVLSAFGTLALYFIGMHMFKHRWWAFALATAYAFSYPRLYFNAFLLGEPFAVPLFLVAIWLLFHYQQNYRVYWAGLVLAFAVGVRPSNGLLGLPFALYILFAGTPLRKMPWREWFDLMWPRAIRTALFSLAFLAVIFTIVAENYRVSDGKLRGITAHAGYNFFLGQTQSHMIFAQYEGIGYGFVPSSVAGNPEFGTINVPIPIYDSARFMEEGWRVLAADPWLWVEHFYKYKFLFFDNLFPATSSVLGFDQLFDPFRYLAFYMLVFSGLVYIGLKEKAVRRAHVLLFAAIFLLSCASLYFFTVTHQYFMNFSYSVYALFFLAAFSVSQHYEKYKKQVHAYIAVVATIAVVYYAYQAAVPYLMDEKFKVTLETSEGEIVNFEQPKEPTGSETIYVNNLQFFESDVLHHGTLGKLEDYSENFWLTAETEFEVLEDGEYMFTFYADDGYRVFIDGKQVMGHNGLKTMSEFERRKNTFIKKGRHTMRVELFQNGVLVGLVGFYKRIDRSKPPLTPYDDLTRKGQGKLVGDDDAYTRFFRPQA